MIYRFIDQNKEGIVKGSDSLLYIDGRLKVSQAISKAREISTKRKIRAVYIAKQENVKYDNLSGKYFYFNLIRL